MGNKIVLKNIIKMDRLEKMLRKITLRGIYDSNGDYVRPYKNVRFTLTRVYPPKSIHSAPEIIINKKREQVFTPQPTIYQNQIETIEMADKFLKSQKIEMTELKKAIEYIWEGRGEFHMLPPIFEKHIYYLKNGYIDLRELAGRFKNKYVKDGRGKLHHLADRYLKSFYIDEVSKIDYLDIFNSNAPIINYGLNNNGKYEFCIICDGAHRLDYVVEKLNKSIPVILVEPKQKSLIPYYAFPVPFKPTIRLSSKKSEKMYHRLERDKIHLFNEFIKKTLHYEWESGGLKVSKLRSNIEIY